MKNLIAVLAFFSLTGMVNAQGLSPYNGGGSGNGGTTINLASGMDPSGSQSTLSNAEIHTNGLVSVGIAAGATIDLIKISSGTGYVDVFHFTCGPYGNCVDTVLNIYVDGETTPSVSADMGNLCALNEVNTGSSFRVADTHTSTEYNQFYNTMTCELKYPIPFQQSLHMTLTAMPGEALTNGLFTEVHYYLGVSLPYKLWSQGVTNKNAITLAPTQQAALLDPSSGVGYETYNHLNYFYAGGGSGWLVDHTITFSNAIYDSFLENAPQLYLDGANSDGSTLNSTGSSFTKAGGEDTFLSGYYFGQVPSFTPYAFISAKNTGSDNNVSANLDLLAYTGGLKYNNGAVYIQQLPLGKNYPGSGTEVNISHVLLYYRPLAPSVPTPTYTWNFMGGTLDSNMTFTRPSTATYINSSGILSTAISGAARFDYNSKTSTPSLKGLLMEGAGTNILTYSNSFFGSSWSNFTNGSGTIAISTGIATGPDGVANSAGMITIQRTSINDFSLLVNALTCNSANEAASVWVKAQSAYEVGKEITIQIWHTPSQIWTPTEYVLTNQWQRIWTTEYMNGDTSCQFNLGFVGGGTPFDDATYSIGTVHVLIYGAQVEANGMSSYIPTTNVAVTRPADRLYYASPSWFNGSAGAFSMLTIPESSAGGAVNSVGTLVATNEQYLGSFSDGTLNNSIAAKLTTATVPEGIITSGGTAATSGTGYLLPLTVLYNAYYPLTVGASYASGSNTFASRGTQDLAGTFGGSAIPSGITRLDFASREDGSLPFNGWIQSFNYWNTQQPVLGLAQ